MPTEDRRKGKLLPSPVVPSTNVCFRIIVPNAVQYRAALMGQLSYLGEWQTWDHATDGTTCEECEEAAQIWRNAIANAVFIEDCEVPLSCEDVTDCIETNPSTKSAVQTLISESATPGFQAPQGQRLPDSVWTQNQAITGTCDPDSFWAQCRKFVDYTVQAGTDFLEEIEVYSNALEAAGFIEAVPVIGTIVDEVQLDQALEFFDWAIEVIAEVYAAADNEANRNEMACALFCTYKDDCELTLEGVFNVLNTRAGNIFTPESIDSLEALISTATTLITSPSLPLDTWVVFLMAMGRVASYLGVRGIDKSLNLMLKLASDQPNDDWILLCEECYEPPPYDQWEIVPLGGGLTSGVINYQTSTEVSFTSTLSSGSWRIVMRRKDGACVDVISMTGGAVGASRGYRNCVGTLILGRDAQAGDSITQISSASGSEFTLVMQYSVI